MREIPVILTVYMSLVSCQQSVDDFVNQFFTQNANNGLNNQNSGQTQSQNQYQQFNYQQPQRPQQQQHNSHRPYGGGYQIPSSHQTPSDSRPSSHTMATHVNVSVDITKLNVRTEFFWFWT